MTTSYDGPTTTIVDFPSYRIGTTAHTAFMNFQTNQNRDAVALPISQITEEMHDIGSNQIVVMVDPDMAKASGFNQGLSDSKSYGKLLIIGQAGNLPHGLPRDFFTATSYGHDVSKRNLINELVREMALKHVKFVGISIDSYRKALGPDHTPDQDGVSVLTYGPSTIKIFTPVPLRPMAELVLEMIPQQTYGKSGNVRYQSDGPEKYPFTLKEMSPLPLYQQYKKDVFDDNTATPLDAGDKVLKIDNIRNLFVEGKKLLNQGSSSIASISSSSSSTSSTTIAPPMLFNINGVEYIEQKTNVSQEYLEALYKKQNNNVPPRVIRFNDERYILITKHKQSGNDNNSNNNNNNNNNDNNATKTTQFFQSISTKTVQEEQEQKQEEETEKQKQKQKAGTTGVGSSVLPSSDVIETMVKNILTGILDPTQNSGKGFNLLLRAMHALISEPNNRVARNLGPRPIPYGKGKSGMVEYDIFVK